MTSIIIIFKQKGKWQKQTQTNLFREWWNGIKVQTKVIREQKLNYSVVIHHSQQIWIYKFEWSQLNGERHKTNTKNKTNGKLYEDVCEW